MKLSETLTSLPSLRNCEFYSYFSASEKISCMHYSSFLFEM